MKKLFWNICLLMLFAVAPLAAQDFHSTSVMRPSGSSYSSTISPVGSAIPSYVESSVGSTSSAPSERHRAAMEDDDFDSPFDPGRSDQSPIGDAWPLLVFAALYAGGIFLTKRKAAKAE